MKNGNQKSRFKIQALDKEEFVLYENRLYKAKHNCSRSTDNRWKAQKTMMT